MFICGNCNTSSQPGQPVNYVVLEKREMSYENIIVKGPDRGDWQTTYGHEIAKQIKACPACFTSLTGLVPRIAEPKPEPQKKVESRETFRPRRDRRDFNRPRKPVDKTNPNWKYKQDLDEIRKREAKSADPRGEVQRKKPVVETVVRPPRA